MKRSFLKRWLGFICGGSQEIENSAGAIARQCRDSLVQRVISRSQPLPDKQIRGYIRAYANGSLEPVVKQWITTEHPDSVMISQVVSRAKELVIEMVVREVRTISYRIVDDIAAAA